MSAPPPPTPTIDDIPQASALHAQLNALNQAIDLLGQPGSTVTSVIVTNEANEVSVNPSPPIADPNTLATLATALKDQANAVTQQLAGMGFAVSRAG
jgi:hypothetical protein